MVFLNLSSDTFIIYKKTMRIYGTWPPDGLTLRTVIIYCAFVLIEIAGTIPYNADLVGECFANELGRHKEPKIIWASVLATLRLSFRLYGNRLTPLIESTIEDWSSIADFTDRRIMSRHDRIGALPFFAFFAWIIACPLIHHVVSFAHGPARFDDRRICDGNHSLAWSVARLIFIVSIRAVEAISYYSSVLLMWSLTMHLSGQYRILGRRFVELLSIEKRSEKRARLRRLVDRHNQLIDLTAKLQDSVNGFVLIDLCAEQLLACGTVFQLGQAIKHSDLLTMATSAEYVTAVILNVLFYYHMGDYLAECSEEIGDALIRNNWDDLSKESLTNLGIVIMRTRAPVSLTAAKLYKLNHDNFKYLLHALCSYFSLILAVVRN